MTIKLNSEDFILGAIAVRSKNLRVEWLASGSYGMIGFKWYLVTVVDGQSIVALHDLEGGSVTCCDEFEFINKRDLTERLIQTIRANTGDDLETAAAVILGPNEDASVNPKFIDQNTLLRLVQSGMAQLNSNFNAEAWAKQVGFK